MRKSEIAEARGGGRGIEEGRKEGREKERNRERKEETVIIGQITQISRSYSLSPDTYSAVKHTLLTPCGGKAIGPGSRLLTGEGVPPPLSTSLVLLSLRSRQQ